jgi:hypothetical protein
MSPFEALVLHLAEAVNTWGDFGMDSDGFVGRKQSPTGQGNSQPIHGALFACRDHFIGRLATLCDDPIGLTCSIDVARRWGGAKEVAPFASFEAASAAVKEGVADAFLVPGAYPHLNGFIMDSELSAFQAFIMTIPPLVLATRRAQEGRAFQTLFHHPAVAPLLAEISIPWESAVHAPSNSEACRMLLANPDSSACVTNALCADHFELRTLKELRNGISMPWICFEKKRSPEHHAPSAGDRDEAH